MKLNSSKKNVEELLLELRSISFNVVSILGTGFDDVRMIGIKGMGGGGKTTLARYGFDQISFQFEGKSFVENVREVSNTSLFGLKSLQTQVLLDVLNDKGISISRIIITTRDEQVLVANKVKFIRDVSLLSNEEAICLFSRFLTSSDSLTLVVQS